MSENLGIEHYLASGELPDDPAILEKLYKEASGSNDNGEQVVDEQSSSASTGAAASQQTAAVSEDEQRADGILSKNGKHVIPYDVLEAERQQKMEAQRTADQLKAEIERLKQNPAGSTTQDSLSVFNGMSEEELSELQEYFPAQYEAIKSQQAALLEANKKLSTFEQQEAAKRADLEAEAAKTAQQEIDNNPLLSHWQRNNPEIFRECCEMDDKIRSNPANAELSLTERFDRVAKYMATVYGNPIAGMGERSQQPGTKTPAKEAADPMPLYSLSDLPTGEAPEASERQRLEDADPTEIANRLMGMSEDQRAAFLNNLG